ncbi:DUF6011 domain-containing protein [Nonomuraea sp. NPDC049400]|uniref:DUF6011 domain-containing protein n=1 Tax=Nonomuraea sp. NPDC049400 TaxID=3364352 RepID=UPI0037918BD2
MTLLDPDGPDLRGPDDHAAPTGRCFCGRKLWDPVSLQHKIGPKCREKLGITPPKRVRITGVQVWRDCEGQTDLLDDT